MRRHRDDRLMFAGRLFGRADRSGRFPAVHLRHLDVHKHDVVPCLTNRRDRLAAVGYDGDLMPGLLQDAHRDPLIDQVVFGQQDLQSARGVVDERRLARARPRELRLVRRWDGRRFTFDTHCGGIRRRRAIPQHCIP